MSLPKPDIHVRISEQAMDALDVIAHIEQRNRAELAGMFLEECLLGRLHAVSMAADRFRRLGICGSERDGGD